MEEYQPTQYGRIITIVLAVLQAIGTILFFSTILRAFSNLPEFTWFIAWGLNAFAHVIVLGFFVLILTRPPYLGDRPAIKSLPIIAALVIGAIGDVIRFIGLGKFKLFSIGLVLYVVLYLLYAYLPAIRPYEPAGSSKSTNLQP